MTNTTATPGFNCRLAIYFDVDRHGRKLAYRWSARQRRAFRMPLDDAELFVATGQADEISGNPMVSAKATA